MKILKRPNFAAWFPWM